MASPHPHDYRLQVWEPESPANTTASANLHTHKLSPYTDMPLSGKVLATIVGGDLSALFGNTNKQPCGSLVLGRGA